MKRFSVPILVFLLLLQLMLIVGTQGRLVLAQDAPTSVEEVSETPASIQACKSSIGVALGAVMGVPGQQQRGVNGYIQQLSDLSSTNLSPSAFLQEIERLARNARIEMTGICSQVEKVEAMDAYYAAAYQLQSCRRLQPADVADTDIRTDLVQTCRSRVDELSDALLERLEQYLIRQAVRTSMEPMVQRMRSLNARIKVLVGEYGRVVNNFFTFNFRLGDTITQDAD